MATASASVEERVASLEERLTELFPPIENFFGDADDLTCEDCGSCLCGECLPHHSCDDPDCTALSDNGTDIGTDIADHSIEGVIQALETLKIVAASGTEPHAVAASEALLGWYQTLALATKD